jgi:hypothetical protein
MTHLTTPEMRGVGGRRALLAWVLVCDGCEQEVWQDGEDPAYATYTPNSWHANGDGTHACPDCVSRAATGHTVGCLLVGGPDHCQTPDICNL